MGTKASELYLKLKTGMGNFKAGLTKARAVFKKFAAGIKRGYATIKAVAKKAVVAITAITAVLAVGLRQAAKYEAQIVRLRGAFEGTDKEFKKFADTFKNMRKEFGIGGEDLAKSLSTIQASIVAQKDHLYALRLAAKMARATGIDVKDTASMITDFFGALQVESKYYEQTVDFLTKLQIKMHVNVGAMGRSFGATASSAHDAGISFIELGAFLAALQDAGTPVRASMAQLEMIMERIQKPTDATKEALKGTGIQFGKTALQAEGLYGILVKMRDAKLDPLDLGFTGKAVTVMRQAMKHLDNYKGKMDALKDSTGTLQQEFSRNMDTMSAKWDVFVESVKLFFLNIFSKLLPAAKRFFDFLQKVGGYIGKMLGGTGKSIADTGAKIEYMMENVILWILKAHADVMWTINAVVLRFKATWAIIKAIFEGGIVKGIANIGIMVVQMFVNLGRIIITFFKNIAKRIGILAKWGWEKFKSIFTGKEVPMPKFPKLLEGYKKWEAPLIGGLRETLGKIKAELNKDEAANWKERTRKLDAIRIMEGEFARDLTKDKKKELDKEKKANFDWAKLKVNKAKETAKKIKDVLTKAYKEARDERRQIMMEEIDFEYERETENLAAKINMLKKMLVNEKYTADERKNMLKEIRKLTREHHRTEITEWRERWNMYKSYGSKTYEDQVKWLKERLRLTLKGSITERNILKQLDRAKKNSAAYDWKAGQLMFRRKKGLSAQEYKERVRWLEEYARKHAETLKPGQLEKLSKKAEQLRAQMIEKLREEGKTEKEIEAMKAGIHKKEIGQIDQKKEEIKKLYDDIKSGAKLAGKSLQESLMDPMVGFVNKLKEALGFIGKIGGRFAGGPGVGMPGPGVGGIPGAGRGVAGGVVLSTQVNIGRGAFQGANLGSLNDRKRAAEQIAEIIARKTNEKVRPTTGSTTGGLM